MSVETQLNALAREVNELRKDVAILIAASELRPLLEDQMQHAQRAMRERHQRPPCETCNGVGLIEGADGAGACPRCNSESGMPLVAPELTVVADADEPEGLAAVKAARERLKPTTEADA